MVEAKIAVENLSNFSKTKTFSFIKKINEMMRIAKIAKRLHLSKNPNRAVARERMANDIQKNETISKGFNLILGDS